MKRLITAKRSCIIKSLGQINTIDITRLSIFCLNFTPGLFKLIDFKFFFCFFQKLNTLIALKDKLLLSIKARFVAYINTIKSVYIPPGLCTYAANRTILSLLFLILNFQFQISYSLIYQVFKHFNKLVIFYVFIYKGYQIYKQQTN